MFKPLFPDTYKPNAQHGYKQYSTPHTPKPVRHSPYLDGQARGLTPCESVPICFFVHTKKSSMPKTIKSSLACSGVHTRIEPICFMTKFQDNKILSLMFIDSDREDGRGGLGGGQEEK